SGRCLQMRQVYRYARRAFPSAPCRSPSAARPKRKRRASARRLKLPLLGSNQDSPDPMPLQLSPPLRSRAFVVWTVPSPSPVRGQVAPTRSLHLPLSGLGSALPVKGSPTSRAFTHVVSGVVSSERTVRCRQSQACCQLHQGAVLLSSRLASRQDDDHFTWNGRPGQL